MGATTQTAEWANVARALASPRLTTAERRQILQITFADKRKCRPLIDLMGGPQEVAEVYFLDRLHKPNPGPQTELMFTDVDEAFYGGARGGGKSYGFLLHFLEHAMSWGFYAKGVLFRRRFVDLEDLIRDSFEVFAPMGGKFYSGGGRPSWRLPGGAQLRFRYLQHENDAIFYQGQWFTWIAIEEAGTYATPRAIDLLRGCLRSAYGVPCQFLLNGNPGGVGHGWLKSRYVDPAPPGVVVEEELPTGRKWRRVFIPARVEDNPPLLDHDPQYVDRLYKAGPEWLVRAWLQGDWDIVAGGMFDDILTPENKPKIIIRPFPIPTTWKIYRALDWGSAKPFSVGWWAVSDGNAVYDADRLIGKWPRGSLFRIAEWYGSSRNQDNPNEGVRMLASEVGREIRRREAAMFPDRYIEPGPADSAIYVADGVARSLGDELRDPDGDNTNRGASFVPSDKGSGSRVSGWDTVRRLLTNALAVPAEYPGLWVFDHCRDWIRTIPILPRDQKNLEDVDTESEDHIADEMRYMATTKRSYAVSEEWRY